MLYANSSDNQKISASPGAVGSCPYCNNSLLPRCGPININHWAHTSLSDCDEWYQQETEWHLDWKSKFPKDATEVVLSLFGKRHIADYYNKSSHTTIEFQNSGISLDARIEREAFYPNLIWVYNLKNKRGLVYPTHDPDTGVHAYTWNHPTKWMIYSMNPKCVYFIDGFPGEDELFQITESGVYTTYDANDFGCTRVRKTFIRGVPFDRDCFVYRINKNSGWW